MNIFITGGTGFIGQHLIPRLAARGHSLLVLSRKNQKSRGKTKFINGDLAQMEKWHGKLKKFKPDAVVHLAWEGLNEHDYGPEVTLRNLKNTLDLLFFAADSGVKKFLSVGSSWEYGENEGRLKELDALKVMQHVPYFLAAKRAILGLGRELAEQGKMQFLWPRLFFAYGPGQRPGALIPHLAKSFREGKTPDIKNKSGANDFIHVEDVAEAIVKILEKSKKQSAVYNIGSGRLTSVAKVANLVAREFGEKRFMTEPQKPQGFFADISLIKKEIGWQPRTSIEQGIKKTLKYLKNK